MPVIDRAAASSEVAAPMCRNGHLVDPSDLFCLLCGAEVVDPREIGADEPAASSEPTLIGEWSLGAQLPNVSRAQDRYHVTNRADGRPGILTIYAVGSEPDSEVYDVLRSLDRTHTPEVFETGRWQDHAYEVIEDLPEGTLADLRPNPDEAAFLRGVLREVGSALAALAERGLRHRDIRPEAILVRSRAPLDLVVSGFGSARLSEFDLDVVAPLEMTRYTAPEAVAGGVSSASDWWSLGMILLEQATAGRCFAEVDDQTFMIHVLATGAPIPNGLSGNLELLFRGLLARDRHERWGWSEVSEWLGGGSPPAPEMSRELDDRTGLRTIGLGDRRYGNPASFSLAAARANHWNEARDLLLRGEVATWCSELALVDGSASEIRRLAVMDGVSEDMRLALALKVLNPAIPLVCRGEIVTPNWLLDHPVEGYELISGPIPDLLRRRDAEPWLTTLKEREGRVRDRANQLGVELEESELRVNLLSTSVSRLSALWNERRRILPDTDHAGLLALIERRITSEDDFILLLSADVGQFRTADAILAAAADDARRAGLHDFDRQSASSWLDRPRRELYGEIDSRLQNFARCGRDRIDGWADQFRLERRLPTNRALVVLAVPVDEWRQPPMQNYVGNLLDFYAKRITVIASRGPLSRMTIGKTTPRIDLAELGTDRRPTTSLLNHILLRGEQPFELDPAVFARDPRIEARLRRLYNHANLYRRDCGIDGMYLAFPFLVMREPGNLRQPRIAPVLLWPVRLRPEAGARGRIYLEFDRGREEVRLNPIFENLLGSEAAERWAERAREILGRASLAVQEVMDAFAELAMWDGNGPTPIPDKGIQATAGHDRLFFSAALFHLAFIGQAVNEDLRSLKAIPPLGSALEKVLRVGDDNSPSQPLPKVTPADRYFTAPSDPSQETAVLEARGERGLLIEGPPGTGKSQTIVNMVADAIGRGRSLLIVCQKQPALDVVHRRLEAEGLGSRVVMVTDVNRDRRPILTTIRDQLDALRNQETSAVMSQREQVAGRLHSLEADLDAHHQALHTPDPATGLSFRQILADLIGVAEVGPIVPCPPLRQILAALDPGRVATLQESCGPLARLWLPARFEGSALAALRPFAHDVHTIETFTDAFTRFESTELERAGVIERTPLAISMDDPLPYREWANRHGQRLLELSDSERARLALWLPLFEIPGSGERMLQQLEEAIGSLDRLPPDDVREAERVVAANLGPADLESRTAEAERLSVAPSFWQRLSPSRAWARRGQRSFLSRSHLSDPAEWRRALEREHGVRPLRERLTIMSARLGESQMVEPSARVGDLEAGARQLRDSVREAVELVNVLRECPQPSIAFQAARSASTAAFQTLLTGFEQGFARLDARLAAGIALDALAPWMEEAWSSACRNALATDASMAKPLAILGAAMPTLSAYQRFRARVPALSPDILKAFAALRSLEAHLNEQPEAALDPTIRRLLLRESRLAWKARLESERPSLLFEADELESKIRSLTEADREMRELNRRLLVEGIDRHQLGSVRDWEDITRLHGPRARRLREFVESGAEIGLLHLRPVWLVNPDVASRLLPLKKALFDAVIYDEASQMPIEYALPTLFRARRAVISGDEKQMPPTSFFSSKVESDEADLYDGEPDAEADDTERHEAEEAWNRREIKDCPDLLQLGKTVLPTTTLQIHYRSAFRELIQFSNASFYANRLSVPVRHPRAEVLRARPIDVIRVDGVYERQTNPQEAERVADVLEELWSKPISERPTVGVVTFNRKQADLIDEVLGDRAMADAQFARVLSEERERNEGGEDVGFFVKNVESVQGDERDVIIFSSTFGRNAQKVFRRSFGVLGQTGGERRLNVAVTRAKEKVVLVTSMPVAEVSDFLATRRGATSARDFLQAFLEYATMISRGDMDSAQSLLNRLCSAQSPTGSRLVQPPDPFQAAVRAEIRRLGWGAVEVPDGGAFGLDFAIESPVTGLYGIGIECDAPRHPLLNEARAREMWRPAVLRKSIPVIHRVSSHRWFHEPEVERARLREAIEMAIGSTA